MRVLHTPLATMPVARHHSVATFRADYADTIELLRREANALNWRVTEVVIQLAISDLDIRVDGGLYANAKPVSPFAAVIIISPTAGATTRFTCDQFSRWHDNVRAIALALEKMRAIRRYGVGESDELYAGFRELPKGQG